MKYSEAVKAKSEGSNVMGNDGFCGNITRIFVIFGEDWATIKGPDKSKNYTIKDINLW